MGVALDYTYAAWTKAIVNHQYRSIIWAFLWALINLVFVLFMSKYQNLYNGLWFCVGVAFGTLLILINKKQT